MSRLSRKFIAGIVVILGIACLGSILFYTRFLEKYYLYQKREVITSVSDSFVKEMNEGVSSEDAIEGTEASHKVIIAEIENNRNANSDEVNDEIRAAFLEKGIGFQKYWLWEEDYEKILDGENTIRLYEQENLNYSLLIEYIQIDSQLFAVTMIIPNIGDAFDIINQFLILVNAAAILTAIIFIIILIQRITKPLHEFEIFAAHMKNNQFVPLQIDTNDELMHTAESLNAMGSQIFTYQKSLQEKNSQMEQLLDDVAHELKTPISLIQLYTSGIRDGLDDGTFIDTILLENQQMSEMVNKLLYVSRINKTTPQYSQVNVTELLSRLIDEYLVLTKENKITVLSRIESGIITVSCEEMLKSVFTNLITNAVKYSSGAQIDIDLCRKEDKILFSVTNETTNKDLELSKIWSPYYVGEHSRSKKLSGTGLGLTIVDNICKRLQYTIECSMNEGKITFLLTL